MLFPSCHDSFYSCSAFSISIFDKNKSPDEILCEKLEKDKVINTFAISYLIELNKTNLKLMLWEMPLTIGVFFFLI